MGRYKTGAETTAGTRRIELSYLLKKRLLRKWEIGPFTLSWNDNRGNPTGSISIIPHYRDGEAYIVLQYSVTVRATGEKKEYNYRIYLVEKPSNLGRGSVLYFVCPQTGNPCRILYQAYGSDIFKSRGAYSYRLYYPLQVSSKLEIYTEKYFSLEKLLDEGGTYSDLLKTSPAEFHLPEGYKDEAILEAIYYSFELGDTPDK